MGTCGALSKSTAADMLPWLCGVELNPYIDISRGSSPGRAGIGRQLLCASRAVVVGEMETHGLLSAHGTRETHMHAVMPRVCTTTIFSALNTLLTVYHTLNGATTDTDAYAPAITSADSLSASYRPNVLSQCQVLMQISVRTPCCVEREPSTLRADRHLNVRIKTADHGAELTFPQASTTPVDAAFLSTRIQGYGWDFRNPLF